MKKTLVIGASTNPGRFSFLAVNALREAGHEVVAIGLKKGKIADVDIHAVKFPISDLHTVSLYIGPQNQSPYIEYIISMRPQRVIFNPGTENPDFQKILLTAGIPFQEDCTLVMLASDRF